MMCERLTCVLLLLGLSLRQAGLGQPQPRPGLLDDVEGGLDEAGGHHSVVNTALEQNIESGGQC